jgi:hypothetical protein
VQPEFTGRDLRVLEAYAGRLVLEPRDELDAVAQARRLGMLRCCFPAPLKYSVRGGSQWIVRGSSSGFRHDVRGVENPPGSGQFRCQRSCDPTLRYFRSRAFEISSTTPCPQVSPESSSTTGCIGPAGPADVGCTVTKNGDKIDAGNSCVFENLTARFAIYRGTEPSLRDMAFTWTVSGGFSPLTINLTSQTASVSPRSMMFLPATGELAVVDGRLAGLAMVNLSTLGVSRIFY